MEARLPVQRGQQLQKARGEGQTGRAVLLSADAAREGDEGLEALEVGDGFDVVGEVGQRSDSGELLQNGGEEGLEAGRVGGGLCVRRTAGACVHQHAADDTGGEGAPVVHGHVVERLERAVDVVALHEVHQRSWTTSPQTVIYA